MTGFSSFAEFAAVLQNEAMQEQEVPKLRFCVAPRACVTLVFNCVITDSFLLYK